ncbi:SDR family oxidoreductase [Haladaptatus caseinilyticus]|uniref:SDR family oxidoreductase n=1 Tax=Haladaptatus caseinilyticus TaxID=2993314 RepID=UPI00224B410C|nr:SDR family oxidoreductase [Haladaptatus caseinilyticus]
MNVVILGCGYVGLELGRQLTASGHDVFGVRRSADGIRAIENEGFNGVRADVTDETSLSAVPDADALVYAVSAGGRSSDNARNAYVDGLRTALTHFAGRDASPERIIYTSSTGVYGDRDGAWVDESTPLEPKSERQEILVEAERIVREESAVDWTIARFAGLYGPNRYRLERYLDGPVSERYLNLIHREDAAGTIRFLLNSDNARDEIVLVSDDEPIWKPTLAEWLADRCGVDKPTKGAATSERARSSKRCSNEKLRQLGYRFRYPTYRDGYADAISAYREG